jgi:hypothetical protein
MIASATNGVFVSGSGSIYDLQHPSSIVYIILRFCEISPLIIVLNLGIMPGFLTMYCSGLLAKSIYVWQVSSTAIRDVGSPPIGKNSKPDAPTKFLKTSGVAILTRWPSARNAVPKAMKGWTSPTRIRQVAGIVATTYFYYQQSELQYSGM